MCCKEVCRKSGAGKYVVPEGHRSRRWSELAAPGLQSPLTRERAQLPDLHMGLPRETPFPTLGQGGTPRQPRDVTRGLRDLRRAAWDVPHAVRDVRHFPWDIQHDLREVPDALPAVPGERWVGPSIEEDFPSASWDVPKGLWHVPKTLWETDFLRKWFYNCVVTKNAQKQPFPPNFRPSPEMKPPRRQGAK